LESAGHRGVPGFRDFPYFSLEMKIIFQSMGN
jgi:hypothetical protein